VFVAINYITCSEHYRERFESLMRTRKGAIDKMPGFRRMKVLRPQNPGKQYLIVSEWDSEEAFKGWTKSEAFIEGHRRGFADLDEARKRGEEAPMTSEFLTYEVLTK
jgi:heme-degrading monooxygenase HmoA